MMIRPQLLWSQLRQNDQINEARILMCGGNNTREKLQDLGRCVELLGNDEMGPRDGRQVGQQGIVLQKNATSSDSEW